MAKKINKVKQLDGKKDVEKAEFTPRTLDQLLGETGVGKYRTLDEEAYSAELKELNKSDLQAHAIKIGLVPIDDRERLTQRLVREFRKHATLFTSPPKNTGQGMTQKKISPELKKILDEGR